MKIRFIVWTLGVLCILFGGAISAADLSGQVLGGGAPIAKSTVTLWEASANAPKKLAEAKTNDEGRFEIRHEGAHGDTVLYIVATGAS